MIEAAMLTLIEDTGEGVLVLVDNVETDEFRRSRLTRQEVRRLLGLMAETLLSLSAAARAAMPEIDWGGWRSVQQGLHSGRVDGTELCWDAAHGLVPATLTWLRVYRRSEPALFEFKP
jgi:uncharacterized protein with HEPN domain